MRTDSVTVSSISLYIAVGVSVNVLVSVEVYGIGTACAYTCKYVFLFRIIDSHTLLYTTSAAQALRADRVTEFNPVRLHVRPDSLSGYVVVYLSSNSLDVSVAVSVSVSVSIQV